MFAFAHELAVLELEFAVVYPGVVTLRAAEYRGASANVIMITLEGVS